MKLALLTAAVALAASRGFLLHKLRGTLELGEGDRMPRGGPYLDGAAIQLVTDWVTGGAPETGFVGSASDCPH